MKVILNIETHRGVVLSIARPIHGAADVGGVCPLFDSALSRTNLTEVSIVESVFLFRCAAEVTGSIVVDLRVVRSVHRACQTCASSLGFLLNY